MAEQLPIEDHYGAMALIKDCWRLTDGSCQWRRSIEQLHGASMVADESIRSDLVFLVDIGYQRLEMAEAVQS